MFPLYPKKTKLSHFTYSPKNRERCLCKSIAATSYKLNVCWTLVYMVIQNQLCINGECSSITSRSGWKQPPIKTIRGQSMCFHPQDGNCTHMAQTLWRSPIQSQIINIKLAGKKSKCQSPQQSSGRWVLPLFYILFHFPHIFSLCSLYRPISPCMVLLDWTWRGERAIPDLTIIMIVWSTVLWMSAPLLWEHS